MNRFTIRVTKDTPAHTSFLMWQDGGCVTGSGGDITMTRKSFLCFCERLQPSVVEYPDGSVVTRGGHGSITEAKLKRERQKSLARKRALRQLNKAHNTLWRTLREFEITITNNTDSTAAVDVTLVHNKVEVPK